MRTDVSTSPTGIVVAASAAAPATISRRRVLKVTFWTAVGAALAGGAATILNMLYPRGVAGFGGPINVAASAIPAPGEPPRVFPEGRFLLVNLAPDEGRMAESNVSAAGGLLALWTRCPHLGCTVPWAPDAVFDDGTDRRGWFRCPCHGSTYTKAGVRVYGPAPRSMDTMQIDVAENGIVVQTGDRTKGDIDNTARAVGWTPPDAATTNDSPQSEVGGQAIAPDAQRDASNLVRLSRDGR